MTVVSWSTFRSQLRSDVLKDSGASQKWSDAQLLRMVNNALRQCWPMMYVHVTDATTATSETAGIGDYVNREYSLPSGVPDQVGTLEPVWMVEVGPVGGVRASDSKQTTDRYRVLRGLGPREKAWRVDYSRRKLILACPPWFDDSATFNYYLRLSYVRPYTELVSDSDTIEGPAAILPLLEEWVRYDAFRFLNRASLSNPENQGIQMEYMGDARKVWSEAITRLRMPWPSRLD